MKIKLSLFIFGLSIVTICIIQISQGYSVKSEYKSVPYYRGLKVTVSNFNDALRILGKPNISNSTNKNQVKFKHNMYFHYKKLGVKIYGNNPGGFGLDTIKRVKIVKIMRKR